MEHNNAVVEKSVGPLTLFEQAVSGLVKTRPDLFAVDPLLQNDFTSQIRCRTDIEYQNKKYQVSVGIANRADDEYLHDEILLFDEEGEIIYRMDIVTGTEAIKRKRESQQAVQSLSAIPESHQKQINKNRDTFSLREGIQIARLDNWAETQISADEARKIIEGGQVTLPENASMTLEQLLKSRNVRLLSHRG